MNRGDSFVVTTEEHFARLKSQLPAEIVIVDRRGGISAQRNGVGAGAKNRAGAAAMPIPSSKSCRTASCLGRSD